jgi:hypothetical protein
VIGVVVALMALGVIGGGGSPLGIGGPPANQYVGQALDAWTATRVLHERGTFSLDGHRYQVDVTEQRRGDGQGTVGIDGKSVQYRYVTGHTYVLGGQDWWTGRSDPKLSGFLAGKWATTPTEAAELSTTTLVRSLSMLDRALPGQSFGQKGGVANVRGTSAVRLTDGSGEVYVSTSRPVRFLRLRSSSTYRTSDGVADVNVDLDYPGALSVQAPDPAVNTDEPRTLPARYAQDAGSFKFSNCDGPGGCTVGATVRNQGGPQVDSPSAEFHLNRIDGADLGGCTAPIRPVAYDQTEDVSCRISGQAWTDFARVGGRYQGKVTVHNPFYD